MTEAEMTEDNATAASRQVVFARSWAPHMAFDEAQGEQIHSGPDRVDLSHM
ncbi:MAG: hypothetical protein JOZ16_18930 [Methylobacteriaceae bacterium]|nr:hypothetical protein [Methylobacteriaceae bacterium]